MVMPGDRLQCGLDMGTPESGNFTGQLLTGWRRYCSGDAGNEGRKKAADDIECLNFWIRRMAVSLLEGRGGAGLKVGMNSPPES